MPKSTEQERQTALLRPGRIVFFAPVFIPICAFAGAIFGGWPEISSSLWLGVVTAPIGALVGIAHWLALAGSARAIRMALVSCLFFAAAAFALTALLVYALHSI